MSMYLYITHMHTTIFVVACMCVCVCQHMFCSRNLCNKYYTHNIDNGLFVIREIAVTMLHTVRGRGSGKLPLIIQIMLI